MMVGMKMPDLAATESQIKVVQWLVEVGGTVERGQPLLEVETDKAAMEVECIASGVLREIRAQPDEEVEVGTVIARMGSHTRLMSNASVGIPEYRKILIPQFKKLAEIGADGLHVDKIGGPGLDFNPRLKLSPDRAGIEGQLKFLDEIVKTCRAINPEFCISTESHRWDRPIQYALSTWSWAYTWTPDFPDSELVHYTFPEWVDAYTVTQPYDYNVVNNAVRRGACLNIALANFTGYMGDPLYQPLSNYIKEIQRIRRELKDTIWMGEYLHTLGVEIDASGDDMTHLRHGVFRNPQSGKHAVVFVNFSADPRRVSVKSFEANVGGPVRIYRPFEEVESVNLPLNLTLPLKGLAIIVEE